MSEVPTLKGGKVVLGPFPHTTEFYALYHKWLRDPLVVENGVGDLDTSVSDVEALIRKWEQTPNNYTFCVFRAEDNAPIGDATIRFGYETYDNDGPEVALMVGEGRGGGYGSAIMKLLIPFAFKKGFKIINASIVKHNVPSVNLFKKFGFTGELKGDEYILSLTRENWGKPTASVNKFALIAQLLEGGKQV